MLLTEGNTLKGKAGTANAIVYTIFGINTQGYSALPQPLAQGYLKTTTSGIYVATRDITVTSIQLANVTGSTVTGVTLYLNNLQVAGAFTIPANGTYSYANGVWNTNSTTNVFTGVGTNQITVSSTPPVSPQLHDLWIQI